VSVSCCQVDQASSPYLLQIGPEINLKDQRNSQQTTLQMKKKKSSKAQFNFTITKNMIMSLDLKASSQLIQLPSYYSLVRARKIRKDTFQTKNTDSETHK
jgi:hypothetical protein